MSYQELRDAGVEYPASVVSELELAGLPVERCYGGPIDERRMLGVRLYPGRDVAQEALGDLSDHAPGADREQITRARGAPDLSHGIPGPHALLSATRALRGTAMRALGRLSAEAIAVMRAGGAIDSIWSTRPALHPREWQPVYRAMTTARLGRRILVGTRAALRAPQSVRAAGASRRRWLAPAALIAAATALAAMAAAELSGAGHAKRLATHRASEPSGHLAAKPPARRTATRAGATPATPVSPALAVRLEAQGHQLLETGQSESAVPVLERALAATGQSSARCREPVSETCLTYAYALYDLGHALRLDHQPAASVLILEHRLQIDNQRPTVQSELDVARQDASPQRSPQ